MTTRPERFDEMARAAHADALDHVSARVHAQLQQRRRAALTSRAPAAQRALWPMLALSGTAAVVLAIGLRFAREPADTQASPTTPIVATTPNDKGNDDVAPAVAVDTTIHADVPTDQNATTHPTTDAIAAHSPTNETADTTLVEVETLLANEIVDDERDAETTLLAANDDVLLADLEENPDLYLWLGSDESLAETTEVL